MKGFADCWPPPIRSPGTSTSSCSATVRRARDWRKQRARLRTGARVRLAGQHPDAAELVAAADVCVVPSRWEEAFCLAAAEPLARGRPLVATRVGAIPELVRDGVTGLLVPPADSAGAGARHPAAARRSGARRRARTSGTRPRRRDPRMATGDRGAGVGPRTTPLQTLTRVPKGDVVWALPERERAMRIPLVVSLAPLAFALACTDEGPIQSVGPKLTISPATVSVETGADPITLQAVPQNGDLTGNVTWECSAETRRRSGRAMARASTSRRPTSGHRWGRPDQGDGDRGRDGAAGHRGGPGGAIDARADRAGHRSGRRGGLGGRHRPASGSTTTFVANAPTVLRSKIIDVGTYTVTADAGIVVAGTLVDGVWDGAVQFDGGTPARSVQVPVAAERRDRVAVNFALRGPAGAAAGRWRRAPGFTETRSSVTTPTRRDRRRRGSRGGFRRRRQPVGDFPRHTVRMYTPDELERREPPSGRPCQSDPTGIAIRGEHHRSRELHLGQYRRRLHVRPHRPCADGTTGPISVGCIWGISFDAGGQRQALGGVQVGRQGVPIHDRDERHRRPRVHHCLERTTLTGSLSTGRQRLGEQLQRQLGAEIPPTGTPVGSAIPLTDFPCPGGLALDKQGGLWVLSSGGGTGSSGSLVSISGGTPDEPAQLADPGHVRRVRLRPRRGRPPHAPVDGRKD